MTLAQIRKHALSLSGTTEEPHFDRTSFRINGRIFVTARPSEAHIHVFVPDEVREPALAMYPDFIEKLLWGGKVLGLRVSLASAKPAAVKSLVGKAYETRVQKDAGPKVSRSRSRVSKT